MIISNEEQEMLSMLQERRYEEFENTLRKYLENKEINDEVRNFFGYICSIDYRSDDYYTTFMAHENMEDSKKAKSRFNEIISDKEMYQKYKETHFDYGDFSNLVNIAFKDFKQRNYGILTSKLENIFEIINEEQDTERFFSLYKTFYSGFGDINGELVAGAGCLGKVLRERDNFNI